MYVEGVWNTLAIIAVLFTITFGFISPGYFFVGCLALAVIYTASETQNRRR
jgi:hypothetical protein